MKTPAAAALVIILLDPVLLQLIFGSILRTTLVLVLFLEGSMGLIAGTGIVLSSTPSISKIGEVTIGSARWSREGEKHAEKIAGKWILASALIILAGFALSIL